MQLEAAFLENPAHQTHVFRIVAGQFTEAADAANTDRLGTNRSGAEITWEVATNARTLLYAQYFFGAADVAIAVFRHHRQTGQWPSALEDVSSDLLPQMPIDEITGLPYMLVFLPDGFVVVSPGNNGVDESAASANSIIEIYGNLDFLYTDDYVFTIRFPPHA